MNSTNHVNPTNLPNLPSSTTSAPSTPPSANNKNANFFTLILIIVAAMIIFFLLFSQDRNQITNLNQQIQELQSELSIAQEQNLIFQQTIQTIGSLKDFDPQSVESIAISDLDAFNNYYGLELIDRQIIHLYEIIPDNDNHSWQAGKSVAIGRLAPQCETIQELALPVSLISGYVEYCFDEQASALTKITNLSTTAPNNSDFNLNHLDSLFNLLGQ